MEQETPRRGTPRTRQTRPVGERDAKPTDEDTWKAHLMNVVREQLRAARERQRLTFDQVSERCTELGYPISRPVLSKIETGWRSDVTLPELLVLCRVLNVPLVQVIAPVGSVDRVPILPGLQLPTGAAAAWLDGSAVNQWLVTALDDSSPGFRRGDFNWDNEHAYLEAARPLQLWRQHQDLVREWQQVSDTLRQMPDDTSPAVIRAFMHQLTDTRDRIEGVRNECLKLGLRSLPRLPDDLQQAMQPPAAAPVASEAAR